MTRVVNVVEDPEKPVPLDVMAEAIVAISEGIKKLRQTRLNDRALYLLIVDAAPAYGGYPRKSVGQREVRAVLAGIEALERTYLKPAARRV